MRRKIWMSERRRRNGSNKRMGKYKENGNVESE